VKNFGWLITSHSTLGNWFWRCGKIIHSLTTHRIWEITLKYIKIKKLELSYKNETAITIEVF
jgi:hypothetical protein